MITSSVIDVDTWTSGWKLIVFSGWMVPALLEVCLKTYIHKKKLPKILDALSNSSCIQEAALIARNKGVVAKSFFISYIHGSIKSPSSLIERGWISESDIKNFPTHLRRLLSTCSILSYTSIIWLMTNCALISIRGYSGHNN